VSGKSGEADCKLAQQLLHPHERRDDMKGNARILARQPVDDRQDNALRQTGGASNPQFSGRGVGEKRNVLLALGDLVKTGPTGTNVMDIEILLAG